MVRYLSLLNFTQEGARNVKDTVKRAKAFESLVKQAGGKVVEQYWALGEVDGVVVVEGPSDEAMAGVLMKLAQQGFVRTRSMRVYNSEEVDKLVAGM